MHGWPVNHKNIFAWNIKENINVVSDFFAGKINRIVLNEFYVTFALAKKTEQALSQKIHAAMI